MSLRSFLFALGLGAGAMYLLDPDNGHRRQMLLRDKFVHLTHRGADWQKRLMGRVQWAGDRATGFAREATARMQDERVPDDVLVERVRAALGRATRHPGAIMTQAQQGRLILSGQVLADDLERVIATMRMVRGV
ncbi:MAG TPA: hypothetical protein V6D47_15815, partial [Oscillatoriaceae cyanobacterium]